MNRETERAESRAHMNRSGGLIKAWSAWLNPGSKVHQSLLILGTGFRHPGKSLHKRDSTQGDPDQEQPPTDEVLGSSLTRHVLSISGGSAGVNGSDVRLIVSTVDSGWSC